MAFDQRLRVGLSESETGQLEALLTRLRDNVSYAAARSSARSMPSRSPQAGLARLGHHDDVADLPAGDPAALEQAFVVLTAIIGLLTAGYAASLRRAVRRPECDICVRLPAEDRNSVSRKGNMPVRSEN
jgi:hypothetical protein